MSEKTTATASFLQKFSATQRRIAALKIPRPTYLVFWVHNHTLDIEEYGGEHLNHHKDITKERNLRNLLINWVEHHELKENIKYVATEIIGEKWLKPIISDLWLKEDIVPYFKVATGSEPITVEKEYSRTIAKRFNEKHIVLPVVTAKNEVDPAELVTLEDYRKTTTADEFKLLLTLAEQFKGKKMVFINATPQGGGVAIMRHALIRLYRLLGVDAHWYILSPLKQAFDITKMKFHNVLQAVSDPSVHLTDDEKKLYSTWIAQNATFLKHAYKDADVVVIDDPQPCGLIPFIKKANPKCKILYRSHIQIVAELATKPGTPQHNTWSFIWDHAKLADLFVSHPILNFIPSNVPKEKTVLMPATTDDLDGLNKPMHPRHVEYYLKLFDQMLLETQQEPLDRTRPYIIQVARFDPAKGIPDVIESYRALIEKLHAKGETVLPQLVIVGHGSIDDPEGVPIYNLTRELTRSPKYAHLEQDIKIARLPAIDQLLNVLLQESLIALQLSHKEGFEVKVTEALMKNVPVVAYQAGGIPLQIVDGVSGYLVPVGDTDAVAHRLYKLVTNPDLYQTIRENAKLHVNPETTTISNAINWLFLATELLRSGKIKGNAKNVKDLIKKSPQLKTKK